MATPTWIDQALAPGDWSRALTEDDPRAPETPPRFRGKLTPPQAAMVQAMVDIEERRALTTATGDVIRSAFGRIEAPFSGGKTVMALALACMDSGTRSPADCGMSRPFVTQDVAPEWYALGAPRPHIMSPDSEPLACTVVIASATIISQWEENIRRFTDLTFMTLADANDFKKKLMPQLPLIRAGLCCPTLFLVKHGTMTAALRMSGEAPKQSNAPRPVANVLALALGRSVRRVVIDDFDMLRMSPHDLIMPARFTWFVSATRREPGVRAANPASATDHLPMRLAARDDVVNQTFNVRCDQLFADGHSGTTNIQFRQVTVQATILRGALDGLLGDIATQALNCDAYQTAAANMGIRNDNIGSLPDLIRAWVNAQVELSGRNEPAMKRFKDNIRRMYSNITTDKSCVVCLAPFKELHDQGVYVFMGCCGCTLCSECMTGLYHVRARDNRCPHCRSAFDQASLLFIGLPSSIDGDPRIAVSIRQALEDCADSQPIAPIAPVTPIVPDHSKSDCVVRIVQELPCMGQPGVVSDGPIGAMTIQGLLAQNKDIPRPDNVPHKTVVYAHFGESLHRVRELLVATGVRFVELCGTRLNRDQCVAEFRSATTPIVMLIASPKNSAGIELTCATRVILHSGSHLDPASRGQIVARAHRIGRRHNLEVITVD